LSHVTDVKLRITNLDALAEAADKCGLVLMRDQKTYTWYGHFVGDSASYGNIPIEDFGKSAHALRLKDHKRGDYEIGLHTAKDGEGFQVVFDSWGPGQKLAAAVGLKANTLRREYAAAVASRKATETLARKGWRVVREDLPGNQIRLRLRHR